MTFKNCITILFALLGTTAYGVDTIKISALPLGSAATVGASSSFPYVDSTANITKRLGLYDLINLPPMVSTYAPIASPTFTGTVTAPAFVGSLTGNVLGNLTGNASTATALAANPTDCSAGQFANAIAANGNLTCAAVGSSTVTFAGTQYGLAYYPTTTTLGTTAAGTTTTVLHGNASGVPTFGAVGLTTDVTGTLPFGNGGLGIATATSGGIPYFSGTTSVASSGLLAANQLVLGGGAATTPATLGSLGTTTTLLHGNAAGAPTFGAVNLATDTTGVAGIASGGTNSSATATAGGLVYGSGTALLVTAAGTASQWVLSGGTGAPTMSNTTTSAKTITGSADAVQWTVTGNATQTSNIADYQKSDSTKLLSVTNVNGTKIRGTTTNDAAATGFIGEYLSASASFTNFSTSTQYADLVNISLTAGDWDVTIVADATTNGATVSFWQIGISITSGNSATGLTAGDNFLQGPTIVAGATEAGTSIANYRMSLASTTLVYYKYRSSYSGGPPQLAGRISARRVR